MTLFIDWKLFDLQDIVEDVVFFIGVVFLFYAASIKGNGLINLVSLFYVSYVVLETVSYMAISSNFSSSFMYLLLESNKGELNEFVSSYVSLPIVLFFIVGVVLFFKIKKYKFKVFGFKNVIVGVLGFLAVCFGLKYTGFIESNVYHNIVRGVYGYVDLQNNTKFNENIDSQDLVITSNNEVLVFVLGESTVRTHMQIYGYKRENTPLLNSIKDSLFIFENVVSSDVLTLKAMPKILTSIDVSNKQEEQYNIVEVFNAAGYNTYWLSNQRPISYHDNVTSKIASRSKEFKFFNHNIDKHSTTLDGVLLPDYSEILKKPGKKAVFVRLIGTHFDYNKRYPEAFKKYGKEQLNLSKEEKILNHYDNAVYYNDYIVHTLIDKLKGSGKKSALVYLSDHGENLYDEGTDFFGRNEERLTATMFKIPFLLWTSNNFEYPKDFQYIPNRKFMADHTYESVGHVFGVLHKSMQVEHSIFSSKFKPRNRKVVNAIDFDKEFVKQND
ncbi:phosphoethanolamine transferase [Postechiella marina]|uniref:phosphoethanolamine transferase n=1 Tax=Postechiella marina TaxID=943941 RepID=UPI0031E2A9D9